MAQLFSYYDDWKNALLTCPQCGWTGTIERGSCELYEELFDFSCPNPHAGGDSPILAIVSFPTMSETKNNWGKLSEGEKAEYERSEKFLARLEKEQLRDPTQLPNVAGDCLRLVWDFETRQGDERRTVIRCGQQVLWDEPAVWEGFERFREVAAILKSRYGVRLKDLEPTEASLLYLGGDALHAFKEVERVRAELARR